MHVTLFVDDKVETFGVVTQAVHNVVLSGGVGTPNWWSGSHDRTAFPINTSCHTSLMYINQLKVICHRIMLLVKTLQDEQYICHLPTQNDHLTSCKTISKGFAPCL